MSCCPPTWHHQTPDGDWLCCSLSHNFLGKPPPCCRYLVRVGSVACQPGPVAVARWLSPLPPFALRLGWGALSPPLPPRRLARSQPSAAPALTLPSSGALASPTPPLRRAAPGLVWSGALASPDPPPRTAPSRPSLGSVSTVPLWPGLDRSGALASPDPPPRIASSRPSLGSASTPRSGEALASPPVSPRRSASSLPSRGPVSRLPLTGPSMPVSPRPRYIISAGGGLAAFSAANSSSPSSLSKSLSSPASVVKAAVVAVASSSSLGSTRSPSTENPSLCFPISIPHTRG